MHVLVTDATVARRFDRCLGSSCSFTLDRAAFTTRRLALAFTISPRVNMLGSCLRRRTSATDAAFVPQCVAPEYGAADTPFWRENQDERGAIDSGVPLGAPGVPLCVSTGDKNTALSRS